ncbi:MAG TPA: hypothetical protein VJL89_07640 [Thermodesulfovibrionia bacterium]|nr:hypothetical protein [Thermodesulfovibrionia bacterium]
MSHKTIFVVGYPKSGCTSFSLWLTSLVAELLECPVKGFWEEQKDNEIAIEGQERTDLCQTQMIG